MGSNSCTGDDQRASTRRDFLKTATAIGIGAALSGSLPRSVSGRGASALAAAPRRGGTLRVAGVAEPLSLDIVTTTADVTCTITLPIFEELITFDSAFRIRPHLAASYTQSKDGLTYTFTLRSNVPFHNGREMTADDVVASLNRWGRVSPRGTTPFKHVDSVSASGRDTVVIKLKEPFAPLLAFLAIPNGSAAIMPKEIVEATGTGQLKQYVGTGPYRFVEWIPDRYVRVNRFDSYASRTEEPSGYAGRREALADAIYYYPVPQVTTRIAGVQSGDYDVADAINQDAYAQLKRDPRVVPEIIRPGSYLTFYFNRKQGLMTNTKLRQAILVALDMKPIMQATFGDPDLYSLGSSIYPKGTRWYTTAGQEMYNVHNAGRAKQLMKEAGYAGEPIRWVTTKQYDYMFKSTTVAASQLELAGFKVDMQVVDWATELDRRSKPGEYDLFTTSHGFVADPALTNVFNSSFPGWWDTPEKDRLFDEFNSATDPQARVQLWAKLQALLYADAALVRPGEYFDLFLRSRALQGFHAFGLWIILWNVQAVK